MSVHTFAELFSNAVEAHGSSLAQIATWLSARGFAVHRSTLGRWRDGSSRPGSDHLGVLQHLPEAIGLSPEETAQFQQAVSRVLDLPFGLGHPHAQSLPAFPYRRHLGAAGYAADDLPPFAGRAAELAELRRLVLRRRSVLITGTGGVGKTRLAQEVLRVCVRDFAHGCDFLRLDSDQDGALVIRAVARLLGLELQPEELVPANRRLAISRLRHHVAGVSLLFLLDNVSDTDQVRELAQELRAITWVITARRASLKRIGVHPLPLRLPGTAEAAAIFRAHLPATPIADRDDDRLVARVADKVDGLPFALRLSAAVLANNLVTTVAELDEWLAAGGLGRGGSPTKKLEWLFDSMLPQCPPRPAGRCCCVACSPCRLIRLSAAQAVGEAPARGLPRTIGLRWRITRWSSFPTMSHVALHARLHEHVPKRLAAEPTYAAIRAAFAAHYLALAESVSLGKRGRAGARLPAADGPKRRTCWPRPRHCATPAIGRACGASGRGSPVACGWPGRPARL